MSFPFNCVYSRIQFFTLEIGKLQKNSEQQKNSMTNLKCETNNSIRSNPKSDKPSFRHEHAHECLIRCALRSVTSHFVDEDV